jgi:hypothetical protein
MTILKCNVKQRKVAVVLGHKSVRSGKKSLYRAAQPLNLQILIYSLQSRAATMSNTMGSCANP